jgi:hypothetical protein
LPLNDTFLRAESGEQACCISDEDETWLAKSAAWEPDPHVEPAPAEDEQEAADEHSAAQIKHVLFYTEGNWLLTLRNLAKKKKSLHMHHVNRKMLPDCMQIAYIFSYINTPKYSLMYLHSCLL